MAKRANKTTRLDGNLRDRCNAFLSRTHREDPELSDYENRLRALYEFVLSEVGRSRMEIDPSMVHPVILYFASDKEKDAFVEVIRSVKPDMIARRI